MGGVWKWNSELDKITEDSCVVYVRRRQKFQLSPVLLEFQTDVYGQYAGCSLEINDL